MSYPEGLLKNRLYKMMDAKVPNIEIETKFTKHYIEKVSPTAYDRGRYRWFAEMKKEAWDVITSSLDAQRCMIDGHDMFPRYYFLEESLVNEILEWIKARGQEITKIFAPQFSDQI